MTEGGIKVKNCVIYASILQENQYRDLESQISFLQGFAKGKGDTINKVLFDVGKDFNRTNWCLLMGQVFKKNISRIYVTTPDRFITQSFDRFLQLCNSYGTEIVIADK